MHPSHRRPPFRENVGDRVTLARALASGNHLLLLDEPFASLNEGLRRELWMTLRLLQETMGLTVLLITHDL